ncbi:MAG TPA: hypothetical protein VGP24_08635 [Glaciihabitans sp.]|nr:hypothetical protein [Glaciihabitans sp.]
MTTPSQLGVELSQIVAAVPGVQRLYPPTHPVIGALAGAADAARGALTSATESLSASMGRGSIASGTAASVSPQIVAVTSHLGEIQVAIRIGVLTSASAAEVCRSVHDSVADYLSKHAAGSVAAISVKVARIG